MSIQDGIGNLTVKFIYEEQDDFIPSKKLSISEEVTLSHIPYKEAPKLVENLRTSIFLVDAHTLQSSVLMWQKRSEV